VVSASVCQISSKSLEPRPIYVSFNIMLVWLENAIHAPFWGFLGVLNIAVSSVEMTVLPHHSTVTRAVTRSVRPRPLSGDWSTLAY